MQQFSEQAKLFPLIRNSLSLEQRRSNVENYKGAYKLLLGNLYLTRICLARLQNQPEGMFRYVNLWPLRDPRGPWTNVPDLESGKIHHPMDPC